ncbi:beta-xylosidase [Lentilactobacillus parafarraginis]|uniref:Beta-xylosidase n=1 Tax=Lentilactobacillus parafarraginis TaxID=390842 RepID=A0A5R9D130_9LACO|nr:CBM35 domain-containing protein [Lentilactobacillus parafarraginis]TLQ21217.1 beta-xylosidase [Lentilactobacillus parafarraginis]
MKAKHFVTFITTAALGLLAVNVGGRVAADDNGNQAITVDTNTAIRNQTEHVASGGLYAMSHGNTPNENLLSSLKPKTFTQPGPGAQQIPNGEPTAAGDFTSTAPLATKVGAKVIIRLADIYSQWPYNYTNEQDWLKRVDTMVTSAKKSNPDAIYGYELWNEPNGTWQGQNGIGKGSWGDFDKVWQDTYKEVKKLDPNAKIVGPSLNSWQPKWMTHFLTMAKNSNTLPDVISWHQWGAAAFPQQAAALKSLEASLGISPRKISINEYGSEQELAVPGQMIHYVQNFENVPELDSADLAFWFDYGRMDNLLTDQQKPNGGYWLYKWYGDMSGQMDKTSTFSTNGNLASVANTTSDKTQTSVILGGTSGSTTVSVNGLDQAKLGKVAHVEVKESPWYGVDTAVDSPKTVESGTVDVSNGSVQVPVKNMKAANGYQVVVTPGGNDTAATGLSDAKTQATDPIRVEAEDGALTGTAKKVQGSYASGNYFVGTFDSNDSSDTMKVTAPESGTYQLELGYANGGTNKQDATDKVTLNGQQLKDAVFPYSTGWTTAVPNVDGTRKTIQYGTVSLKQGDNTLKLAKGNNAAELDYAQFTLQQTNPNDHNNGGAVVPDNSTAASSSSSSSSSVSSSSSSQAVSSSSSSTKVTAPKKSAHAVAVANASSAVKKYRLAYNKAQKTTTKAKYYKAYKRAQAKLANLKHPKTIKKAKAKVAKAKASYKKAKKAATKAKYLKEYKAAKIALNKAYIKYSK